jgi:hypothetical protein
MAMVNGPEEMKVWDDACWAAYEPAYDKSLAARKKKAAKKGLDISDEKVMRKLRLQAEEYATPISRDAACAALGKYRHDRLVEECGGKEPVWEVGKPETAA